METNGYSRHDPTAISPEDVREFFLDVSGLAEKEEAESDDEYLAGLLCVFCADILNDPVAARSWRQQIRQYIRANRR